METYLAAWGETDFDYNSLWLANPQEIGKGDDLVRLEIRAGIGVLYSAEGDVLPYKGKKGRDGFAMLPGEVRIATTLCNPKDMFSKEAAYKRLRARLLAPTDQTVSRLIYKGDSPRQDVFIPLCRHFKQAFCSMKRHSLQKNIKFLLLKVAFEHPDKIVFLP